MIKKTKKYKLLLWSGAISIIATPVAVIISCGSNDAKTDQDKLNDIDETELFNAFDIKRNGFSTADDINQPGGTYSINGLNDINISIENWQPDIPNGEIQFDALLTHANLNSRNFTNLKVMGFEKNDQKKMDAITKEQVLSTLSVNIPQPDGKRTTTGIVQPHDDSYDINNVKIAHISIDSWVEEGNLGKITFNATISKNSLIAKKITGLEITGYVENEQFALDNVLPSDVINALSIVVDSTKFASDILEPKAVTNVTITNPIIGTLSGVSVEVAAGSWHPDAGQRRIVFDAKLSKGTLTPKIIKDIEVKGYKDPSTPQGKLDSTSEAQILAILNVPTIDTEHELLSQSAPSIINQTQITINTLDNVNLTISAKTIDSPSGTGSFSVQLSQGTLTPKKIKIDLTGYAHEVIGNSTNIQYNASTHLLSINDDVTTLNLNSIRNNWEDELTNINFGTNSKLLLIGYSTFYWASKITTLELPQYLKKIENNAFDHTPFTSLTFKGNIPIVGGRQLSLEHQSFQSTPINAIKGTLSATESEWQDWAQTNFADAFKH